MNIETEKLYLEPHPEKGSFDIYRRKNSSILVKNAHMTVFTQEETKHNTTGQPYSIEVGPYRGRLGKGTIYRFDFVPNSDFHFQLELITYKKGNFITLEGFITNLTENAKKITYMSPLEALASEQGGLFNANNPKDNLVFENGLGFAFEFFMRSFNSSEESESSLMQFIYHKDEISQNVLLGILSLPEYLSEVISNDEETKGIKINEREGIAEWRAQAYFPFPKPILPQETLSTGVWVLQVDEKSGFNALENYGDLIVKYNNINLWPHEVPHGWNSWNNPVDEYRDYSYVTNINENIILDNMHEAVKWLKSFGLKYWQLDNGYSPGNIMTVDNIIEDRFPHGMKYIAEKIREQDLIPGIWINPFNVGIESDIFKEKEKEGWFPEPDPSFPVKDKTWRPLDLSIPEAQQYFRRAIRKVVKQWGYKILKVDFAYLSMAPIHFHDKSMTSAEVHRIGWKLLREEAGEDVFIYGIGGPIGLHYGIIDGERITLDTLPRWHPDDMPIEMLDVPQTGGSVFYNYRTMARRYFYNNRVWFNHLDCFSFRPSLTKNEAMMLINATGMLGGIWKIGDKLVEMKEEHFQIIRKILPVHKQTCRPLDIFHKLIPEILHLRYKLDGSERHIISLSNWGPNRNLIEESPLPSKKRTLSVNFREMEMVTGRNIRIETLE